MVGTHVDITEYMILEERLRASEAKFRSFIQQAAKGIMLTDEQGIIIEFNPAAERILGLPCAEAIGQPAWSLMERLAV
jgi:PAS domain S-box-containing protein